MIGLGTENDRYRTAHAHVPKWSRGTEHLLFGTEMVCTEMDRYRTWPTLTVSCATFRRTVLVEYD